MALEIFRLFGSIFVDTEEANKSISKVDKNAQSFGKDLANGIATAGKWGAAIVTGAAAAATALASFATQSATTMDTIDKMSQKIGISRESYQELSYVFSQNGADVSMLQTGMKTLTTQIANASKGTGSSAEAFEKLGISVKNADGSLKSSERVLYDSLAALQKMRNETERNAIASQLFGRSATELQPLLNAEAGTIGELTVQAHQLGLVFEDDAIDAGVDLKDTLDSLTKAVSALVTGLGNKLVPIVQQGADIILAYLPTISSWLDGIAPLLTGLLDGLLPPLTALAEQIFPPLLAVVSQILPILTRIISGAILPAILKVLEALGPALVTIAELLVPILETLEPIFDLLGPIVDLLTPLLELVVSLAQPLLDLLNMVLKPIVDFLKAILLPIIDAVKWALDGLFSLLPEEWKINLGFTTDGAEVPQMAYGGVLERGQVGLLEGNGAEAVVPLENNRRWISAVANDMAAAGIGGNAETVGLLADILRALEEIADKQIVLDTGRLVGALAGPMDRRLGEISAQKARA